MTSVLRGPFEISVSRAAPDWYLSPRGGESHPEDLARQLGEERSGPGSEELLRLAELAPARDLGDGRPPRRGRDQADLAQMSFELTALTGFFGVGYIIDQLTGALLASAAAWLLAHRLGR